MNEKVLEDLIEILLTSIREDGIPKKDFEKIVEELKDSYMTKNPESPSVCVFFKIDQFKEYLAKAIMPEYENVEKKDLWKLILLWQDYNTIEHYLSSFISVHEAICCSVDKGRWLLNNYMNYIINKEEPDMEKKEKEYWKPSFGTFEEWFNFIDGYIKSRYSFYPEFLIASAKLFQAGKKSKEKK